MSSRIRKQIYIEPRQEHLLKAIAQQAGVSEAEIIRQAKEGLGFQQHVQNVLNIH